MAKQFDVLKHRFVPRHEVLPEEDAADVLERYKIRPEQLPRLLVTDPAAMAIGARPGELIKITRDSQVAGETVAYRLCVEG